MFELNIATLKILYLTAFRMASHRNRLILHRNYKILSQRYQRNWSAEGKTHLIMPVQQVYVDLFYQLCVRSLRQQSYRTLCCYKEKKCSFLNCYVSIFTSGVVVSYSMHFLVVDPDIDMRLLPCTTLRPW